MKQKQQTKKLLLEQLRKTPIVQIACEKIGVARATFYRWKTDDKGFGKLADEALFEGALMVNDLAESQLIGAIKERNLSAATYWLRHHHPQYKAKVEVEGTLNTKHELTPEQEALVRKALELANFTHPNREDNDLK